MRALAHALLSTCLARLIGLACAQQQGDLEQRSEQLDRDRDEKLTPQELPGEWFGRPDTIENGLVTPGEARARRTGRGGAQDGPAPQASSGPERPADEPDRRMMMEPSQGLDPCDDGKRCADEAWGVPFTRPAEQTAVVEAAQGGAQACAGAQGGTAAAAPPSR